MAQGTPPMRKVLWHGHLGMPPPTGQFVSPGPFWMQPGWALATSEDPEFGPKFPRWQDPEYDAQPSQSTRWPYKFPAVKLMAEAEMLSGEKVLAIS